jgi:hypothetical protein
VWELTAYFDESGHPRDPKAKVFGMGCVFAPATVWSDLEIDWRLCLDEMGIGQFHASDCETGGGAFRQWPKQQRLDTFRRFAELVAKYELAHISCVMDLRAYRKREHEFDPKLESPYILAFVACLGALIRELDDGVPADQKVSCVIELQQEYKAAAQSCYETLLAETNMDRRLAATARFAPKGDFVPFQVVDMTAYEFGKFHLNRVYDPSRFRAVCKQARHGFTGKEPIRKGNHPRFVSSSVRGMFVQQSQRTGSSRQVASFPTIVSQSSLKLRASTIRNPRPAPRRQRPTLSNRP